MDTTVRNLAVAEYIAAFTNWLTSAPPGEVITVVATVVIAFATVATNRVARIANSRQNKESIQSLKREREEKLVNLANFILEHRELFYNTPYPLYDKSDCYEAIISFNIWVSEETRTKKIDRHNFVIVRERKNHNNILSFTFIGEHKVNPMSIEVDKEPEFRSNSDKWGALFDALKSSLNIALIRPNEYQLSMHSYYEMESKEIEESTGLSGMVVGHVGMNSEADRKLVDAILSINIDSVKKLIGEITHIDARDIEGKTFLHHAVEDAHNQIISDKNYSVSQNKEFLHKGISRNYARQMQNDLNCIISILVDEGADVNAKDNRGTPIIYSAASVNNPKAIYILETSGADVNSIANHNNGTAIHIASYSGWDDVVEKLMEHGAKVHSRDSRGETPLHMAAASGWASTIEKLIEHGSSVNDKSKFGETPLHKASLSEDLDSVEMLIQHGAKRGINDKDEIGETPLHNASWSGSKTIIEILIRHKADINVENEKGETPLHIAINNIWFNSDLYQMIADTLIRHGADRSHKDKNGNSPDDLILKLNNRHRWYYILLDTYEQKIKPIFYRPAMRK